MENSSIFVFMKIEIGTYKNLKSLRDVLEANATISTLADDMLEKLPIAGSKQILSLAILTVNELGFPKAARAEQIYEAAIAKGMKLCPAEVGPQLRIQYKDQPDLPSSGWLHIGMEPIENRHFTVGRYRGVSWLNARGNGTNDFFELGCPFVFAQT